ncbi:MAG: histidine phosphatase family protein [Clostridia bacterium]|nr:histidine phosphatase family protein [Clostridia bacterium]MBR5383413.1 histidine phosphatase family protein [Clostridia bacterium]
MLYLFVIRHGETTCNVENRHTGWLNYPLTEKGIAQAERAGSYCRNLPFDRYYCSDIQRTRETFAHIFGPREDCIYTPLLRELNSGECAGKKFTECEELYEERYRYARRMMDFSSFNGENMEDLHARARAFLNEMEQLPPEVRSVAAVSHGMIMRGLYGVISGVDPLKLPVIISNCGTIVYQLDDNGKWRLRAWNVQDISSQTDLINEAFQNMD